MGGMFSGIRVWYERRVLTQLENDLIQAVRDCDLTITRYRVEYELCTKRMSNAIELCAENDREMTLSEETDYMEEKRHMGEWEAKIRHSQFEKQNYRDTLN